MKFKFNDLTKSFLKSDAANIVLTNRLKFGVVHKITGKDGKTFFVTIKP